MSLKSWWRGADPVGKRIIKWFSGAVLIAIFISIVRCVP